MRSIITLFSLLITMFSINFDVMAARITAITDGANWSTPAAWDLGRAPVCGDTIVIPAGVDIRVSISVNLDSGDPLCDAVRISVSGSLLFNSGRKMRLASGACMTVEAGGVVRQSIVGGGASENITIGGTKVWQSSDGTLNGYATMGCPVVLPVSIVEFTAFEELNRLNIDWTVSSEDRLAYYTIWGSADGQYWEELTKVTPHGFHGIDSYSVDLESYSSVSYVKLETTDFDGSKIMMSFAAVKRVALEDQKVSIYPNPIATGSTFKIQFESKADEIINIQFINTSGQIVGEKLVELERGLNVISIETDKFTQGIYIVNLQSETQGVRGKLEVL